MRASNKLTTGIVIALIAIVAAAAIFSNSIISANDSHVGGTTTTSFAATMSGTFEPFDDPESEEDDTCFYTTVPPIPGDTICNFNLQSSGHSTLLGKTEDTSSWKLAVPPLPGPGTIIAGSVTLSGKKGELHLVPIGPLPTLNIVGPPNATGDVPGVVAPPQAFQVIGGTGPFEDATGTIVMSGSFSVNVAVPGFAPGKFDIVYYGAVSY